MSPIFSNTICSTDKGATTWEVIYNKLEDEHPKVIITRKTTDLIRPSRLQFKDVSYSFLHRIGVRAKIIPYTNMIRWVAQNLTIEDMQFKNLRMELMDSFRVEDLKKMCHIPDLEDVYDKTYVANFAKKNEEPLKMIQGQRVFKNKFKFNKSSMYHIASLANHYNY